MNKTETRKFTTVGATSDLLHLDRIDDPFYRGRIHSRLVPRIQGAAWQYLMFLAIFLAFLALAWLFDFVPQVPFRQDWRLLTPYLALYYAMSYGFVVMVWERSLTWGLVMLTLLGIQLIANLRPHFPKNALA